MQDDLERILFHETAILSRLDQLAAQISQEYRGRELTVIAEGGPQSVAWPASDAEMRLTGPAEIICKGVAL
jgi:diaminopimelate epimerase